MSYCGKFSIDRRRLLSHAMVLVLCVGLGTALIERPERMAWIILGLAAAGCLLVAWRTTRAEARQDRRAADRGGCMGITLSDGNAADLRLVASVFENALEGILVTDATNRIVSVNPAFTELTGYTAEEALGKTPAILKSDIYDRSFYTEMWEQLTEHGRWQGEIWNRRKNGDAVLMWESINAIRDDDGRIVRHLAVFSDITELRRKDDAIHRQALHDVLTGLPNRFLLQDRLRHEINKAAREDKQVAVMFLDLDRFKVVNDTLGHRLGDDLLKKVADRLGVCLRRSDSIGRLGGDVFIAILPDLNGTDHVVTIATKVLSSLVEPLALDGHEVHMTASIGVALFPKDGPDSETLMKNADTAMYQAKAHGRNTFRFFNGDQNARAIARLDLESRLRRAAFNGELELHYQPKLCLRSGHPCGAEALVRWRADNGELIAPADFISLAEDTGLIVPIGEWVIHEACRQVRTWEQAGFDFGTVAVNVSAHQLRDQALVGKIDAAMRAFAVSPECVEIELTESAVMQDPAAAAGILGQMREAGLGISIDDFGTGYSSLAYLKRLPITGLKIDRSFVAEADSDPDDAAIVATIIGLAATLGLHVVAEGVETTSQLRHLARHGCDLAQGYLFAKPLPAAEYRDWHADWPKRSRCFEEIWGKQKLLM